MADDIPTELAIPPFECTEHPLQPQRTKLPAPLPTNSFYSDLFLNQDTVLLFPHPYVLRLDDSGVGIQKPKGPDLPSGSSHAKGVYPSDALISFEEWWGNQVSFLGTLEVLGHDFASVTVESALNESMVERGSHCGKVSMPITRGMAFVTFVLKQAKPRIRMVDRRLVPPRTRFNASDAIRAEDYLPQETTLNEDGSVRWKMPIENNKQICVWFHPEEDENGNGQSQKEEAADLTLEEVETEDFDSQKGPKNDSAFKLLEGGLDLVGQRALTGVMRVAILSDEDFDTSVALMDVHSLVYPTGCSLDLKLEHSNYIDSIGYTFDWHIACPRAKALDSTEEIPLLHFALPHHQQTLTSVEWTPLKARTTTKGEMQACLGKAWHFSEPLLDYLKPIDESAEIPGCWQPPHPIAEEVLYDVLSTFQQDAEYVLIVEDSIPGHESQDISTYFKGKALFRLAQMCLVAEGLMNRLKGLPIYTSSHKEKENEVSVATSVETKKKQSSRRKPIKSFWKKIQPNSENPVPNQRKQISKDQVEQLGETLQLLLERLKKEFLPFLENRHYNLFLYDCTWGGVMPHLGIIPQVVNGVSKSPDPIADFGSSYYNDHHYHWGYLVHVAAVIAHFQRDWGERQDVRSFVESLIRDTCNPNMHDPLFPFSRSFDWWSGHCWSRGLFPSPDGKDLESVSEETNLHYAILLWGQATNQSVFTRLGTSLLHLSLRSFRAYILMAEGDPQCAQQGEPVVANKVPGIFFEGRMDYRTWFGNKVEFIHGIQMIPMTPISEFLRRQDFSQQEYELLKNLLKKMIRDGRSPWTSVLLMGSAVIVPREAFTHLKMATLDDGLSRSWALFWASTRPNW